MKSHGRKREKNSYKVSVLVMAAAVLCGGCGQDGQNLNHILTETQNYVMENTPAPSISSIGGDWAVTGLAKSNAKTEEYYYESYYDNVRAIVKSQKGILSEDTYTEYARVSLALCAIEKDPLDVEGYNLIQPLDDYEVVTTQGINAAAFALIASNVSETELENEEKYIQFIISQTDEGNLYSDSETSDYIAMAMEGLSFYEEREDVKEFTEKGVSALSEFQQEDGSIGNCESTAEAIMALTQLGIDVREDERFIKNGNNLWDGLMKYYIKDGGFCHATEENYINSMATEKALLAMDAMALQEEGQRLYEGAL